MGKPMVFPVGVPHPTVSLEEIPLGKPWVVGICWDMLGYVGICWDMLGYRTMLGYVPYVRVPEGTKGPVWGTKSGCSMIYPHKMSRKS